MAIYFIGIKCYYVFGDGMIDCKLKQIHRVRHTIPIEINTQTHKCDELVYFISGYGSTQINDKVYSYKSGDFAFYKKGTPHNECDPQPCDIIWLHFDFNIDNIDLKEGVFCDNDGKLLSVLQKLRRLSIENSRYSKQSVESCLAETIIIAAERQENVDDFLFRTNWEKVLNYIDANANENIDFALLAKNNNYSYDRFRHLFSERFGVPPYTYLTLQRIEHAKRLLKNSNSSITDIAFDCGFNSSSQFTNILKKHIGVTPKEYKKRVTSNP